MIQKTLFILSLIFPLSILALPVEKQIGQMLMLGFHGTSAPANSQICQDIRRYHLGGGYLV
ncbi:MAG: hypothetical protein Q9M36_08480 [Sulfurovum sp.]|nr:hypothetical protein [Sulfurovum sp.]